MRYIKLRFTFKASGSLSFPPNPVNTFRGALGFQLQRLACIQRSSTAKSCKQCSVAQNCAYAQCYETSPAHIGKEFLAGNSDVPHLMAIDALFNGLQPINAGECFDYSVILFGRGVQALPHVILAALNAGRSGFTRERVGCEMLSVIDESSSATVWSSEADEMLLPEPELLNVGEPFLDECCNEDLQLKFITPVAFKDKKKGKITLEPDFARIIGSIMRRYTSFEVSDGNSLNWRFAEITRMARKVRPLKMNLEPVYWERFSTRQRQRIPVAGVIGLVTFTGPVRPFLQLLKVGEIIRCGRSISFGQGRIYVDAVNPATMSLPKNTFCTSDQRTIT